MKKQVVHIHGAEAFSHYGDFLKWLKTAPVDDPRMEYPKGWKHTLPEMLPDHDVYLLSMPNKQNAKYKEWKIWFERHFQFFRDDLILVGHSQGGYFLAKYLSENRMSVAVRALYLVAAPVGPGNFDGEDGGDFAFDTSKLKEGLEGVRDVFIFHSKDDPVVPFLHVQKYKKLLPQARLVSFDDRGHFLMEEFPELIASIQGISR